MATHPELIKRIETAPREELLEAARFFARKLAAGSAETAAVQALAAGLAKAPLAQVQALEQLSRALLLAAARDDALAADVQRALDGAARKQFVLGGAEIVALAVVAVIALKVVITKGVGESQSSTRVTMHPDGRVDIVVDESKKAVTITDDLAAMVRGSLADGSAGG